MRNGKLQAAILGCGVIGNTHAKAILSNSNLVELYAVCDIIPEKAQEYQKQYGAEKIYTDMEEMLKDPAIDMVSICTPSGYHAEHAIACARHGKNILSEKPLDITTEKVDQMIEAFRGTNLKAAAVFQYRTYAGIQKARELIKNGTMGRVLVSNAYYKQYRSPEYYRSAGWRGTWEIDGGGCTMNQGIHILDILCYLNDGAASLMASTFTQAREIPVEDTSFSIMTFHNGAVGTYQATTLANPPVEIKAELMCENGRIVFENENVILYTEECPEGKLLGGARDAVDGRNPAAIGAEGHAALIRNLANAIMGKEEVLIGLEEGRKAVEIICAMYESSKKGGKKMFFEK
ncbi:MAG: Gfo/Idh/MocA family oxidoreductase [Clostridiales bacterium]|nr:Gfo/Idh/MocA family oxidoreductase [Clostridiales bacterium]